MDIRVDGTLEIWYNGRFLCTGESAQILYGRPSKDKKNGDITKKKTVISIKAMPVDDDTEARKLANSDKEYNAFFEKLVKRVGDPEYHTPVSFSDN